MASKKAPATTETPILAKGERLHGDALLAYVDANRGVAEKDLIKGAGYWRETVKKDSDETYVQINVNPFYKALAAAKQLIELPPTPVSSGSGTQDRRRFRVRTNPKTGNAVITGGYMAEIGVQPGEYIRIEVTEAQEVVLIRDDDQTGRLPQDPGQTELPLSSDKGEEFDAGWDEDEAEAA